MSLLKVRTCSFVFLLLLLLSIQIVAGIDFLTFDV